MNYWLDYPPVINICKRFAIISENNIICLSNFSKSLVFFAMIDTNQLWDGVLAEMELSLSKANFSTWFRNTCIAKQEDSTIYVSVPNTFVRDWLINKYHKNILHILRNLDEGIRSIEYLISKIETREDKPKDLSFGKQITTANLGLNELYINKESNLNPKYTLDSFVVGSFNEVAYAAALAVMKEPGTKYNPLFIYGGTGLGKTHLIQSVGNHFRDNTTKKNVFYITSETFASDLINSIINKKAYFVTRYRQGLSLFSINNQSEIDLIKMLKKNEFIDCEMYVGVKEKIKIRLIAVKLPDQIAAERKRNAYKNKDSRYAISKTKLFLLNWEIYMTNLSLGDFSAESICCIYRLRWQIEIVYKTWKSYCNFSYPPNTTKRARIEGYFWARLLFITLLYNNLFSPLNNFVFNSTKGESSLSIIKFFRFLSSYSE